LGGNGRRGAPNHRREPHVGGALHTPEDALWLLRQVESPWIKLVYDFSHYELRGFKLDATLELLAPLTAFVACERRRRGRRQVQVPAARRRQGGLPALSASAQGRRYCGAVVVEVSGMISNLPNYDPVAAAKKSYAPLAAASSRLASRAGS